MTFYSLPPIVKNVELAIEGIAMTLEQAQGHKRKMMNGQKAQCVLCNEQAVTTAAGILVCSKCHDDYQAEGRQYLPFGQRVVYQRLLMAQVSCSIMEVMVSNE